MRIQSIAIVLGLILALGMTVAGEVDFHNCAICKPMATTPGLMQNVSWETTSIATGMVSITTVKAGFEEAYEKAHTEMMANVAKLESGAEMDLCPFCQSMGKLAQAGAQIENIDAAGAHVMVVTSKDPAVIDQIHGHVKWVKEEFSKMDHEHKG